MSHALSVVILAAGQGTRMKSSLPKVLHKAVGQPLLEHVLRAAAPLKPERIVVVIGHGAKQIKEAYKDRDLLFVEQDFSSGYGTGHALLQTASALHGFSGDLLVLNGDGPLLRAETLTRFFEANAGQEGMALLTCEVSDPKGLGRIIRAEDGSLARIVEEKDATPTERKIREINPGIFLFDANVFKLAQDLTSDNAAGEYYITDLPDLYLSRGYEVRATLALDEQEVLGVNTRKHLAEVERILRNRIRDKWLDHGVTLISPEQTFIDDEVILGKDVVIEPGVVLKGKTQVKEGAYIAAYAHLEGCTVEENAYVPAHTVKVKAELRKT